MSRLLLDTLGRDRAAMDFDKKKRVAETVSDTGEEAREQLHPSNTVAIIDAPDDSLKVLHVDATWIETLLQGIRANFGQCQFTIDYSRPEMYTYKVRWITNELFLTYNTADRSLLIWGVPIGNPLVDYMVTKIAEQLESPHAADNAFAITHHINVDHAQIDQAYSRLIGNCLDAYSGTDMSVLLRSAIVNMYYIVENSDYSHLVDPATRALEGYIKHNIVTLKGSNAHDPVGAHFRRKPNSSVEFELIQNGIKVSEHKAQCLGRAYTQYYIIRHPLSHYGRMNDALGDTTRLISRHEDAVELIMACINCICEREDQ